jgi:predicted ATP-dependent serine protease
MKAISMETIAKSQKPINWIWKKYIPEGVVSILAAKGGVGKSGFALHLASLLAEKNYKTLYVDYEQTTSHMSTRWKTWKFSKYKDHIFVPSEISTLGMYESVRPRISEIKEMALEINARLIIIDSMSSLYETYDIKDRAGSVKLIEDYRDIANTLKCGLLLLAHVNKAPIDSQTKNMQKITLDLISGSGGIPDMARSVMGMTFHNENQNKRIIYHLKHNFTQKQPDIIFTMSEDGITNINFGKPLAKPIHIGKNSGTKIGRHVEIMKQGLLNGITEKKELLKLIKEAGGSAVDATKAYKKMQSLGHIII